MNEREFLYLLQERAKQQEKAMQSVPFPKVFTFVVKWLSYHPWRFLIPLAFLVTLLFRAALGSHYTDFILWVFREFISLPK